MAVYLITAPDGKKFRVTGEGTKEEALAQVQAQYQQPQEQAAPSTADQGKRALGRTARIVAEGAAYFPLAAMDAGVAARNLLTGSQYQMPSEMYREGLDAMGLPRPEGTIEKVVDFVGQSVVGSRATPTPGIRTQVPNTVTVTNNAARDVIREGERRGVPVFFDDVTRSATARKVGTAAESLPGPFGTGAGRASQAKAAQDAAGRFANQFSVNTSDDVPALVQRGLKARLNSFRASAGKLYDRAAKALDPLGDVPLTKTQAVISREIASQQSRGTLAKPEVLSLLEKYQKAPTGNFSLMRELRSQLSDDISDFYTGSNSTIGEKGVTALKAMKDAIDQDLADFARKSGGQGLQAWRAADGFYKANIVPFREAGFRDLVKTAEPEKAWRYLLASGGIKSRAARMYNSLDEGGRAAVRHGLVKDAMENARNPNGSFSPAKFAKYFEDHEATISTFFRGRDLREVNGFRNLMRHIERAGQFAENPPTGNRLIPYLLGGAAVMEPTSAAVIGGSGLGITRLFQTRTGRDLLLAAGRTKSSAELAAISERMARFLSAASVRAAQGNDAAKETAAQPQE